MTDVPPPDESPKARPPRGRPRPQKPLAAEAILSDEEVARRVAVEAGTAPKPPVERAAVRAPRTPTRRTERTGARDSLLLIGLVIVGLVAVRLFLPDGPLTASATSSPDGGATQAAVATESAAVVDTAVPTGGLITLTPTAFVPTASPGLETVPPVTSAPSLAPTPPPAPTPTLRPGQTPQPTPRPTRTPTPTPTVAPTVRPTATPPGTATVIVKMHVVNDDGGDNVASDWTMKLTGEIGTASPNSFPGSESGTSVTIPAGKGYLVTDNLAVSGYLLTSPDPDCKRDAGSGGLAAGTTVTCTITRNDQRAHVNVTINYFPSNVTPPEDTILSISGANANPTTAKGSDGTTSVALDSNASWSIDVQSVSSGWTAEPPSGTCSSSGLDEGQTVSCTYTFDQPGGAPVPAPVRAPIAGVPFLTLVLPRRWIPRRWRTIRAR